MKIKKKRISSLPMVYATSELILNGKRYLCAASEAAGGRAYIIDPDTYEYSDLWVGETGVMNIIQIPGEERLLVITKFFPVFQSKDAQICLVEPSEKGYMSPWIIKPILNLPFCHRIGLVKNDNGLFLLGCQLCRDKSFQEDWTQPGSLWIARIPSEYNGEWKWYELYSGLTKNHGLYIKDNIAYICSEEGVLAFNFSNYNLGDLISPILVTTTPTSDIWISDTEDESIAATIEPFHGNNLVIYRFDKELVKYSSYHIDFGHVVWAGNIMGKPVVIAGSRGGKKGMEIIDFKSNKNIVVDNEIGPTQISVYTEGETVYIFSANHESGDISIYSIEE